MLPSRIHPLLPLTPFLAGILLCALFFVFGRECMKEKRDISAVAPSSTFLSPVVPAATVASGPDISAGLHDVRQDNIAELQETGDYRIDYDPDLAAYRSMNSGHALQMTYRADGFIAAPIARDKKDWSLGLRLESINRGDEQLRPLAGGEQNIARLNENCLEMRHDGFTVEYVNTPEGTRQNFIVNRRPAGNARLRVQLRTEGDLRPVVTGEDDAVFVRGEEEVLKYTGLKVWDAVGTELAAHMEASDDLLALVVEDARAKYPVTIDPLLSEADWTADSTSQVADAGDVNNDGYDDVIISGSAGVRVYHGSATGLPTTPSWKPVNTPEVTYRGYVAGAGDVNGDSYDDVIVEGSGNFFVFLGSSTGLQSAPVWTTVMGVTADGAGDVNGDGYDDIIIGEPVYDNGIAISGAALAYYGSPSGPSLTHNWLASTGPGGSRFGHSVAGAGDVNGDGYDDVIVGSPFYRNVSRADEGATYIYFGSATGLKNPYNWMVKGNISNVFFGTSVDGAGDVNGDGYDDVISGLPSERSGTGDRGRAYVFLGSANGVAIIPAWILGKPGPVAPLGEQFGASVSGAGDVDGDGLDDVIVGAYNSTEYGGGRGTGSAFIFYGGSRPTWSVYADFDPKSHRLGWSVSGAGDVNGDGTSEVLISTQTGRAFAFYGSIDSLELTGVVVNHQGIPIAGATVKLDNSRTATTNANGRFTFAFMEPGPHTLTVSATGYQTATFDLNMPNGDKHVVLGLNPAGDPPTGPFTICGTVTEQDGNGPPLNAVTVEIFQGENIVHTTTTDPQGKFCSIQLDAGNYQVRFSKSGYQTFAADLKLDANKQIVVSLLPSNLQ